MSKRDVAIALFEEGFNCAQAVSAAFCDEAGVSKETMVKMSSGFGGGFGRLREVCGAVSGMVLVANLPTHRQKWTGIKIFSQSCLNSSQETVHMSVTSFSIFPKMMRKAPYPSREQQSIIKNVPAKRLSAKQLIFSKSL